MSKSSKKRLSGLLIIALATLCLVTASVIATLYYAAPQTIASLNPFATVHAVEPEDQASQAPHPSNMPAPIFLELQPFTAMLHDAHGRRRVLYVAITLRVEDEYTRTLFTEYMPEVRDRILRKLSEQDPIAVQTPDGRTLLAQELSSTLQTPYHLYPPYPRIHSVLFTAFVVQ